MQKIFVEKGRYVDSVTLMGVGERAIKKCHVKNAEGMMATPANIQSLQEMGYEVPEDVTKNDLLLAVTAETEEQINAAKEEMMLVLNGGASKGAASYRDLDEIDLEKDPFDLVQISLPGEYAAAEAKKAIEKGLDVFIFSDNVSMEEELELKQLGREKGRLVMGPDCGVGLIGGVALAAGSINKDGPIGIVGASGSGAQEVACLIERMGLGVHCLIGTGGRDLKPMIGGITMRMGMEKLDKDPEVKVICLVSKLADLTVMSGILDDADKLSKPVVAVFLGGNEKLFEGHKVQGAMSLEEAARKSVALITGEEPKLGFTDEELKALTDRVHSLRPEQKYFRGLYCGGTFTEEALILFSQVNPDVQLYSNLETKYAKQLADHAVSQGHAILDMGAEDFTAEAPHPVFDPALRVKRVQQELTDPEVAVVLLDFITGPGVALNPIMPYVDFCAQHKDIIFIATICGAEGDPQDIRAAKEALVKAGVIVADSNYQSAKLAAAMMAALDGRQ
ncbi:MAG: hypothetical protein PUE61_09380 [Clostridiales bacterium]|nr:hypothetical protein [Clostridiales bacterium]